MFADGNWSDWTAGPCNNCGNTTNCSGSQVLTRTCTNPAPCGTGSTCPGNNTQTMTCGCPISKNTFKSVLSTLKSVKVINCCFRVHLFLIPM